MTPADLRATLRRLRLSQVALARLCGVDERTVHRWVAPAGSVPAYVTTILRQQEALRAAEAARAASWLPDPAPERTKAPRP